MLRSKVSSMVCLSRYRHLLSAALDDELNSLSREAVERHVVACRRCAIETERLRLAKSAILHLEIPEPDTTYPGTASLLSRRVDLVAPAGSGEQGTTPQDRKYRWSWIAVPACVVIIIGALLF